MWVKDFIVMRREVYNWWKQAEKDFEGAAKNLKINEYYITAFLSQQAAEKSLKALYIHKKRASPGSTHSLIFLANELNVPEEFMSGLRKLNPDFIITRYPDAAQGLPYELYDREIAEERLEIAGRVMEWVRKELEI
ncbi:MAG: HEPN domain-containing protein [Methanothermobacter wolfeii]|nr:HEPN domain-containing protein [Methanothermobacter wolfeii]MDI6842717.1 HEPN domain-containing protein [Methanothermobacter wolfeii]